MYFNTFTLINNGKGTSLKDNIKLTIENQNLSLYSQNFKFSNAFKTGKNEMYNDSEKGDMIVSEYLTQYYRIALIRYIEIPNEIYLKIVDRTDNTNYLIHLHNKY